jgi:hypothetical protein
MREREVSIMSFCPVDKLMIIKKELEKVPAWNKLDIVEQCDCRAAILDGLEEIEKKDFEYKQMAY